MAGASRATDGRDCELYTAAQLHVGNPGQSDSRGWVGWASFSFSPGTGLGIYRPGLEMEPCFGRAFSFRPGQH